MESHSNLPGSTSAIGPVPAEAPIEPFEYKPVEVSKNGFSVLWAGMQSDTDIVLVHGLGGHPEKTWSTTKSTKTASMAESSTNGKEKRNKSKESSARCWSKVEQSSQSTSSKSRTFNATSSDPDNMDGLRERMSVFWPAEFLPEDFRKTRILSWGYESNVSGFFTGPVNKNSYHAHARDLLYDLNQERTESRGRPIIWIAHSLGGIIVKEVLVRANSANNDDSTLPLDDIYYSTKTILFLGTPHRGSSKASWGLIGQRVAKAVAFDTNPKILKQINDKSPELEYLREQFSVLLKKRTFTVRTFQEAYGMTALGGLNSKVVEDESSTLDDSEPKRTIPANHMNMCRFSTKNDIGYRRVSNEISDVITHLQKVLIKHDQLARQKALADEKEEQDSCLKSLWFEEIESRRKAIFMPYEDTCNWLFDYGDDDNKDDPLRYGLPDLCFINYPYFLEELSPSMSLRGPRDSPRRPKIRTQRWRYSEEGLVKKKGYLNWRNLGGLLWIKGKAGSGKSTFMKHLLRKKEEEFRNTPNTVVAGFFFNGRGVEAERSAASLFRALLWQIFHKLRQIFDLILPEFRKKRDTGRTITWDIEDLKLIFEKLRTCSEPCRIYIFVDALDEMTTNAAFSALSLILFLEKVASPRPSDCGIVLSICFSSRPIPSIDPRWSQLYPVFQMQEENKDDITTYVRGILEPYKSTNADIDLTIYGDRIIEKADGVFLWVSLVSQGLIEDIAFGTQEELENRLRDLPVELSGVYSRMLQDSDPKRKPELFQMVCLVLFAERSLSLEDLRKALYVASAQVLQPHESGRSTSNMILSDDMMAQRMQVFSQGLLEIKRGFVAKRNSLTGEWTESMGNTVQVIHQSAIDFFLNGDGFSILQPDIKGCVIQRGHDFMLSVCLDAIRIASDTGRLNGEFGSFLQYAIQYWPHHAQRSSNKGQENLVHNFLSINRYYSDWMVLRLKMRRPLNDIPLSHQSPLCTAVQYDLFTCAHVLLTHYHVDVNYSSDSSYFTALGMAMYLNRERIITLLFEHGANPSSPGGLYGFALQTLACLSHFEGVMRLLSSGANIYQTGGFYGNALQAAVVGGDLGITRLLLDKNVDVNATTGFYGTALHAAAYHGNLPMVELLLDYGAVFKVISNDQLNSCDKFLSHHFEFISESRPASSVRDKTSESPLSIAAANGHYDIMGLLLRKCDGDLAKNHIRAAIDQALQNDDFLASQLLEDHILALDGNSSIFDGSIYTAATEGQTSKLKFLIQRSPYNAIKGEIRHALEAALAADEIEAANILQDYQACVQVLE